MCVEAEEDEDGDVSLQVLVVEDAVDSPEADVIGGGSHAVVYGWHAFCIQSFDAGIGLLAMKLGSISSLAITGLQVVDGGALEVDAEGAVASLMEGLLFQVCSSRFVPVGGITAGLAGGSCALEYAVIVWWRCLG